MPLLKVTLIATFFIAASSESSELSSVETKLQNYVQEHAEEAISFLERLVEVNSGTMNSEGVRAVGAILERELEALGFETRWIDFPEEVNRAGHLFAHRKGRSGNKLLLIGHLDTVFEPQGPFQHFERKGDEAFGPGVGDMKGGDVVLLYALKALHSAGALEDTTITLAFTGDEEKPGSPISLVRGALLEAARESDIALGFEGSVGPSNATVARRGSSNWTLEITGKRGHSSQIFSEESGAGAIFEASRILSTFYQELRGETYLTFNPGVILGGSDVDYDPENATGSAFGKTNVIAQTLIVHGGLRFISEEQKERARDRMRDIVGNSLPETEATITFKDGYPAMSPSEGNEKLFALYDAVSRDLGQGAITAIDPGARGAADISFVAPLVDSLAGIGPVGHNAHSEEESLELGSLSVAAERAAVFIYRLTR